jgi:serine/threonine-protein kinase RsbW
MDVWIPSEVCQISPLADRLLRLIKLTGCVPSQEMDVGIALREALSNAVLHGNRMDPRKQVYVCCRCEPGTGLSVVVRDEGVGFDPRVLPDALTEEGIVAEHGRGILLMRFYMDEVSFEKGGTEVHMRKRSARAVRQAVESQPQQRDETLPAGFVAEGAVPPTLRTAPSSDAAIVVR